MINGLEGIPGSGKSYEAVVMHVLPALKSGRKVITNLPLLVDKFSALDPAYGDLIELRTKPQKVLGVWDAEAVDDVGNGDAFRLFSDGENQSLSPFLESVSRVSSSSVRSKLPKSHASVFGSVWDFYSPWKHPVTGLGPLFIIDECHLAMPAAGTDPEVIEWFKLHRHFNADVLLATQSFRDMCQPIARLFEILIRCRKATVLGHSDRYIRKVFAGYRGAEISTEQRKYQTQYFALYKSHTQGNSVGESAVADVQPFIVKFRRFTWAFWVFAIGFCIYAFWPSGKKVAAAAPSPRSFSQSSGAAPLPTVTASVPATSASAPAPPDLEPLKDKQIHITGWLQRAKSRVSTFAISAGGVRQFDVLSSDLVLAGYTWQPMGECMGYLKWQTKIRAVLCDAPVLVSGSSTAPVVMDAGSGKRSDGIKASRDGPVVVASFGTPSGSAGDLDVLASMHKPR
jgi:zona occludens toxin